MTDDRLKVALTWTTRTVSVQPVWRDEHHHVTIVSTLHSVLMREPPVKGRPRDRRRRTMCVASSICYMSQAFAGSWEVACVSKKKEI